MAWKFTDDSGKSPSMALAVFCRAKKVWEDVHGE